MKILIAGASGLLGRALTQRLRGHDIVRTALSRHREGYVRLDARDAAAVSLLVRRLRPDVIVNLIGERRPEFWGTEGALSSVNIATAVNLATASAEFGARFVHASTDYVFDGQAPPYTITALHNPLNSYGRTKSRAEAAVLEANPDGAIVRMPVLYGEVERLDECNLSALVPIVMAGTPAAVDHWAVRRPTLATDVAGSIVELAGADNPRGAIYHVSATDPVTKYEMAVAIGTAAGVDTGHLAPDHGTSSSRPRDTSLDCRDSLSLHVDSYSGFTEGLSRVLPGYLKLWRGAQES